MKKTAELLAKADEVLKDRASDFIDVGSALRRLQDVDGDEYKSVIAKHKLGSRQAYYWVSIDRAFEGLGIPKDRLRKIGWTKLKDLTAHVTKDNVKDLLKLAETHTGKDLERLMQGEEVLGRARAVNLRFPPEDYELLHEAMLKFGAIPAGRGLEAKEDAIIAMVKQVLGKE